MRLAFVSLLSFLLLWSGACSQPTRQLVELKHFPLDSLEGVRATSGVAFDPKVSSDGQGSLRVEAREPLLVPLFEVTGLELENTTLVYEARLQTDGLEGKAYLEMWVGFEGRGEFFSRGLDRVATGTMSWMTLSTPFFLQEGHVPELIRLNLVVEGTGTVWIDQVRLLKHRLPGR